MNREDQRDRGLDPPGGEARIEVTVDLDASRDDLFREPILYSVSLFLPVQSPARADRTRHAEAGGSPRQKP